MLALALGVGGRLWWLDDDCHAVLPCSVSSKMFNDADRSHQWQRGQSHTTQHNETHCVAASHVVYEPYKHTQHMHSGE